MRSDRAIRISVVVACRNERDTLAACLDALEAQDHPAFEVVVVDGRSTDGSADLVRARGFRVLSDEGRGPGAARNIGVRAARADVVAFTDADCVPRFDWLSKLAPHFSETTVAGVAGALRLPRTTPIGRLEDNDARVHYQGYITSNIAYRRSVLLQVGGFAEALPCAEDYDLAWRILDAGHRIVREDAAIVLHAPPELHDGAWPYLRKQFWYARYDIPAHGRALARTWRSTGVAPGSAAAADGLVDALGKAAAAAGLAAGGLLRSPRLAGAVLAGAAAAAAFHVADAARRVGDSPEGLRRLVAIEAAKRLARGAGTLVGLAELARSGPRSLLTPSVAKAIAPAPLPARPPAAW